MSKRFFPGITHAMVYTPASSEDMTAMNGTVAIVTLCFGQDKDRFGPIRIKKMEGPTTGVTAELPSASIIHNSKKAVVPTFMGGPADELKLAALVAFDKVKQKYGLKWGKKYKVLEKDIEEVQNAVSSARVG